MANNPKKVKDPTEVALSAIQEALNISDVNVDTSRNSSGNELAPPHHSAFAADYTETRSTPANATGRSSMTSRAHRAAPPMTIAKPSDRSAGHSEGPPRPRHVRDRHDRCRCLDCRRLILTISFFLPSLQAARAERRRAGARRPYGIVPAGRCCCSTSLQAWPGAARKCG